MTAGFMTLTTLLIQGVGGKMRTAYLPQLLPGVWAMGMHSCDMVVAAIGIIVTRDTI